MCTYWEAQRNTNVTFRVLIGPMKLSLSWKPCLSTLPIKFNVATQTLTWQALLLLSNMWDLQTSLNFSVPFPTPDHFSNWGSPLWATDREKNRIILIPKALRVTNAQKWVFNKWFLLLICEHMTCTVISQGYALRMTDVAGKIQIINNYNTSRRKLYVLSKAPAILTLWITGSTGS